MTAPLGSVLALDLSQNVGGAFAGSLLADFGATVLVVEQPEAGTAVRRLVAPDAADAWWNYVGRNKYSLGIDTRASGATTLIDTLLAAADIVITDVGPRGWRGNRWLRRIQSGASRSPLVLDLYASGKDRPELWREGVSEIFAPALTGMLNMTGWPDAPPSSVEAPVAESMAAMMGVMGVLANLRARRSGQPAARVSIATHEAVQRMVEWQMPLAALTGTVARRNGNNFPMNAGISNMPRTLDGHYITFSAASQEVAVRLLTMIGGDQLAIDPRFATADARRIHMDALYEQIDAWCATRTRGDILQQAALADVVAGPIFDATNIASDPEIAERGNLQRLHAHDGSRFLASTPALRFSGQSGTGRYRSAPAVGADNALLSGFPGVTQRRLSAWRRSGALWQPAKAAPGSSSPGNATQRIAQLMQSRVGVAQAPVATPTAGPVSLPLTGLVVIELGTIIAGPFAGSLLSDLGATVIKIENPRQPDGLRQSGAKVAGLSIWWGVQARNKKCISLDLKHPRGQDLFRQLIARADVLIENFRPGTLEKLGCPVESLRTLRPTLTVLSISGYGHDVSHAHRPGFGKIAEGLSGMLPLTGVPDRPPLFTGFSLADTSTGLLGALAVCALQLGDQSSAKIDLALYESLLRVMEFQFHRVDLGKPSLRQGSNHPYGWGHDLGVSMPCVRCADEVWVQMRIERHQRPPAPHTEWADWARTRTAGKALAALKKLGIAAVAVRDGNSLANDRYFRARADVEDANHPVLGVFPVPGFFPKIPRGPEVERFNAASVGEHNDWVYRKFLGLSDDDYRALASDGII